ncbi:MAG: phytanoyl-CoA dioxygenase family protein [Gammaproteobacteria bacterium]|nr:phytanoyl-CoA dioxygenase family protein [Gammaproteobacteria bacterium]
MDTTQYKQDFDRDGFVIIPQFLSADELSVLTKETEQALESIRLKIRKVLTPDKNVGSIIKNMNKYNPWFSEQLTNGKHVPLIKALLDDELDPANAAFFDRLPGELTGINPHFDAIGHRSKGATIWIALDKADQENGCLYYVKGTHEQELESKIGLDFTPESPGATPVIVNPGDAAIHSALCVHWSSANHSSRTRRAISYFYWAASSKTRVKKPRAKL